MKKYRKYKRRGFSLIEMMLVLVIISLGMLYKMQDIKNETLSLRANAISQQLSNIANASNAYINLNYDKLIKGTDPLTSCQDKTCILPLSSLKEQGLLPENQSDLSFFKTPYSIVLKIDGQSPNYTINGMVINETKEKDFVFLGSIIQKTGADAGFSKKTNVIDGLYGSWFATSERYPEIVQAGMLGVRIGYDANMYSIYLRRDGTLPMTGDLNLDKHNINNIQDFNAFGDGNVKGKINADGNIESKGEIISGSWIRAKNGYGDVISIGGDSSGNDYEIFLNTPKPLSIHGLGGDATTLRLAVSGSIASSGNIHADGRLSAGEYISLKGIATIGQSCPDNSLIAKDANGAILACTNGLWQLSVADSLPIGVPQPWPSLTPPKGWMIADGRAFDKARNPKLAVAYPSGRLPDLRGYFIRGLDTTNSRDPNRSVLSVQEDAMQRIYGEMRTDGASNYATGPFKVLYRDGTNWSGGRGASHRFDFDSARVTRTAPETRPKNIAFVYIIQEG